MKPETSDVGLSDETRFAVLGNFWRGSDIRDLLMERFLSLVGLWSLLDGIARSGEGMVSEDDTLDLVLLHMYSVMMTISRRMVGLARSITLSSH